MVQSGGMTLTKPKPEQEDIPSMRFALCKNPATVWTMYFLEIRAENLPSNVGPFNTRASADFWAATHVSNGSWSVVFLVNPLDL